MAWVKTITKIIFILCEYLHMLQEGNVKNCIALQLSPKCIHYGWVFVPYFRVEPKTLVCVSLR